MNLLIAAISQLPDTSPGSSPDPLAGLRDNAPLVEVPWPTWAYWAIGIGIVLAIAGLIWLGWWLGQRRETPAPPSPRTIALRALEALRAKNSGMEPYAFSVEVSDVLRTYASRQYNLRATQQTSPEFLVSIAGSARFTDGDRELLAKFLDRCDLLKFARIDAHAEENTILLGHATAFVQGEQL